MSAHDSPTHGSPTHDSPTLDDEDLPPVVTTPRPRRVKPLRLAVAGVVVALAVGFLLTRALGTADVYFKTADEAVAEKRSLGTDRFRIEGSVGVGSIRPNSGALEFSILGPQGTSVAVVHRGGQPTGLFRDSIPVVLEGRWSDDGTHYRSDRVIVKHSEQYRADNAERVKDYQP